jgi:hypothetical protein
MTYETDERLKSYLDTNQLQRERMCLGILSLDRRFSNIQPRHPRGGPDGGRDIEAMFEGQQATVAAIGFVNQASDSPTNKRQATKKFKADLDSALKSTPELKAFVFFTNVNLSNSEKKALVALARTKGLAHCEIMDRERMRIALDNLDGLALRFQTLDVPMSEAEQAAFFARWGDDIQNVIAEGFGELKKSLKRMQFLHEANFPLEELQIAVEFDREYSASEIGHFRFFCVVTLKEPRNGIFQIMFGRTDRADRSRASSEADLAKMPSGIAHGTTHQRWERRFPRGLTEEDSATVIEEEEILRWTSAGAGSSVGRDRIRFLDVEFGYGSLLRFGPYLRLADLDDCMLAMFLNRSLADKLKRIHIFGNQYILSEYDRESFRIDSPQEEFTPEGLIFTKEELDDEWVRVMRKTGPSMIRFSEVTPVRFFDPIEARNSLL